MSKVSWVQLKIAMFDDEKIKLINEMPESDSIILIWIRLICLAGKCNASGYLLLDENLPYTDEMLAAIFKKPISVIRLALQTFQRLNMIDVEPNLGIFIKNFIEHQSLTGLAKMRLLNAKRQADYRIKRKEAKEKIVIKKERDIEEDKEESVTHNVTRDVTSNVTISIDNKVLITKEEQIYQFYPKKVGKNDALKKIKMAMRNVTFEVLLESTKAYSDAVSKWPPDRIAFVPNPSTWFNQGRYNDDRTMWMNEDQIKYHKKQEVFQEKEQKRSDETLRHIKNFGQIMEKQDLDNPDYEFIAKIGIELPIEAEKHIQEHWPAKWMEIYKKALEMANKRKIEILRKTRVAA